MLLRDSDLNKSKDDIGSIYSTQTYNSNVYKNIRADEPLSPPKPKMGSGTPGSGNK